MKKQGIISIVLAAALSAAFLAGCGKSGASSETSQPKSLPTVSAVETKISSEISESKPESSTESVPESSDESSEESGKESSAEISEESSKESSKESKAESSEESSRESKTESSEESSRESKAESSKESSKEESSEQERSETHSEPVSEVTSQESSKPEQSSKPQSSGQTSKEEKKDIPVSKVNISHSSVTMYEGRKFQLGCYLEPAEATDRRFSWYWSDASVISVDSTGLITALKPGTVKVTAKTPAGISAECTVTVKEKPAGGKLTGITVDPSWFDDAVFVGDSVTNALYNYSDNGWLSDADFICSVGMGYHSALWDINAQGNLHPVYYGKKVTTDEAVRLSGRKNVFIMLGMNDLGIYSPEVTVEHMLELCDRILAKSPDVQIYIESITPLIASMDNRSSLNNRNIARYNELAAQACDERGYVFVNVAEVVSDGKGNLKDELCFDPNYMGLHLNYAGCQIWVNYLMSHVA